MAVTSVCGNFVNVISQPTLESVPQPTELRLANFSLTQLVSDPGSCTGCCKYL